MVNQKSVQGNMSDIDQFEEYFRALHLKFRGATAIKNEPVAFSRMVADYYVLIDQYIPASHYKKFFRLFEEEFPKPFVFREAAINYYRDHIKKPEPVKPEDKPMTQTDTDYVHGLVRIVCQTDFDQLTKAVAMRMWNQKNGRPLDHYWEQVIKSASSDKIKEAEKKLTGYNFKGSRPTRGRHERWVDYCKRVDKWEKDKCKLF